MLRNFLGSGGFLAAAVVLLLGLQQHGSCAQQTAAPAKQEGSARRIAPATSSADHSLVALGMRIVTQGMPDQGVAACASCHGLQGQGMAASGFPRLAGQPPAYLVRQIESFTQDTRSHSLMSPIAKAMTIEQNIASAAYYASLEPNPAISAGGRPSAAASAPLASASGAAIQTRVMERGERLARFGDEALHIQACANCHGPGGTGEPPGYPYLAGQHLSYLVDALVQWKNGQRRSDPSGQMQALAFRLSDADIAAVAAYYAGQPPPSRPLAIINSSSALPTGNSPGRAGSTAVHPSQGVGSEQGSPLTGGRQDAGGAAGINPGSGRGPR